MNVDSFYEPKRTESSGFYFLLIDLLVSKKKSDQSWENLKEERC